MSEGKRIHILYLRLRRYWGWARYKNNNIELDISLKGKKHLEILLHELIHIRNPDKTEKEVIEDAIIFVNTIWHDGYRKVDNSNDIPMQDGTL